MEKHNKKTLKKFLKKINIPKNIKKINKYLIIIFSKIIIIISGAFIISIINKQS